MPENSPALYRAGDGEPLVLVHGFTATWRVWLPVLAELVPRFEVIAPTLHGHDGGPPVDRPAETVGHAADRLEQQLDELGVGEAHFAGNSMGGALVLELAKRGRARSVVAMSPGGGWRADDTHAGDAVIRVFTRSQKATKAALPRMPQIMSRPLPRKLALRDVMAHGDQVPPKEAVMLARSSVHCSVVDDVFTLIRSGTAVLQDLDTIDCPVLVAWGAKDRILPLKTHGPRFRDEIPGVDFRVWKGVGHVPMWDDPGLVAGTLADFAATAHARPAPAEVA